MDLSGQLHAPVALILERRLQYPLDERLGRVGKLFENFLSPQGIDLGLPTCQNVRQGRTVTLKAGGLWQYQVWR